MNMSREIKQELLPKLRARYAKRGIEAKSRMLDELCEDYGYERKYAIKLLGNRLPKPSGRPKPGPCPEYTAIEPVIRAIWLAAEQPCGKRLARTLKSWLPHYERHHDKLSAKQPRQLRSISPATVDRLLAPVRAPITRRTTRTSNKRTGCGLGSYWVMMGWRIRNWWPDLQALQRGLRPVTQLLCSFAEAGEQVARGQSLAQAL